MSITLLVLVAVVATSSAAPFNTSELIYGGQVVNVPYFPFQLILMYDSGKEEAWCGATLISPRYALTAAHCALKFAKEHTTVYGGVYDIKHLENEWSQYSTINNYIIHPHFSGNTTLANNDIALIELNREFKETVTVKPIKIDLLWLLPEFPGGDVAIIGFGRSGSKENSQRNNLLQYAQVNVIDRNICALDWYNHDKTIISVEQICTTTTNSGALAGDSGGPVVYQRFVPASGATEFRQLGIISFGEPSTNLPNVHVRVPSFCQWIADNTNPRVDCSL